VGHKLGRWGDVGWWQLALQERPAEPLPPLPLAEARGLAGGAAAMAAGLRLLSRSARDATT
jgi:phosphinothricin acetyltransferase